MQDENQGGNDQDLQFRRLNVRLLLSSQDTAGYELLPLCRIQRSAGDAAVPCLDPTYFPPMLAIDAWPPLGRDIFREIYYLLGKKIELAQRTAFQPRGHALRPRPGRPGANVVAVRAEPGLLRRWRSCRLRPESTRCWPIRNSAASSASFRFFSQQRRPPEIPKYDHDDLATIFRYISDQIQLLLKLIPIGGYVQRDFVGEGLGMKVSLESEWLGSEWRWFMGVLAAEPRRAGVHRPVGATGLELEARQCPAGGLAVSAWASRACDWRRSPRPRRPCPRARDWLYFEVSRDNTAWKDVLKTQTLAMRLKDTLIVNREELPGERNIVVTLPDKHVTLQFALFAVPHPKARS